MGLNRAELVYRLDRMNARSFSTGMGKLITGDFSGTDSTVAGTLLSSIFFKPLASVNTAGIPRHTLCYFGEQSGTTAFGFGDITKPSYGVMMSFGRTAIATAAFTGVDTSLDVRAINKLANDAAYALQAAYFKAKNYSGATVGTLRGVFIECVADGTETSAIVLKLGTDGTAVNTAIDLSSCVVTQGADIKLSSGVTIGSGTAAPNWAAGVGSLYLRTGQADAKAILYVCTVAAGTWVLLNTVIA